MPWYDGTHFAQHGDVVVVTINYRLGPLGFLHLADQFGAELAGSGNAGILDQVAALEWVRDSIAGFGGDPDNVTIFGESAGANSVGTLLGAARARAACSTRRSRRAAPARGSSTRERAAEIARRTLDDLGVRPGDVEALQALPADALLAAQPDLGDEADGGIAALPWQPVVDGDVLAAAADRRGRRGPRGGRAPADRHQPARDHAVPDARSRRSPTSTTTAILEPPRRASRADPARAASHDYRAPTPDAHAAGALVALATDGVFRIPAVRLAEAQAAHGPVWMYRFTWETPVFGGILRSTHALEIPFVFDTLDQPRRRQFTGDGPERAAIADAMHRAWIAFARTGDPAGPPTSAAAGRRCASTRDVPSARRPRAGAAPGLGRSRPQSPDFGRATDIPLERAGAPCR